MKKTFSYIRDHWMRMLITLGLLALSMHWGGFGDLGVIPGAIGIILWTD